MSYRSDRIREKLAQVDLAIAQQSVIGLIRRSVRQVIFEYAQKKHIMDFADTQLVEQEHRNWRQVRIDAAVQYVSQAQSATSISEILTIFDEIAQYIE